MLLRLKSLSPDDREILLVAEAMAETSSLECFYALLEIWHRCTTSVQAELLLLMAQGWPQQRDGQVIKDLVTEALECNTTQLRRAALYAMTVYPDLQDTFRVAQYLIDPEPSVSTYAAQMLLQHPAEQLSSAARAQLNWLSRGNSPATRALAVTSLVQGGVNRFGERIIPIDVARFQADSSARVRLSVIPAAELDDLIISARDKSSSVRRAAIDCLERNRRRSTRLLQQAIAEITEITPENFQISRVIEYWYLLIALASVNQRLGKDMMLEQLDLGFRQIDFLSSSRQTLQKLHYPPLVPIQMQLIQQRNELTQTILSFVGAVFGTETVRGITRTLQIEPSAEAYTLAQNTLADLTTPKIAQNFTRLLTTLKDFNPIVTQDRVWQPDNATRVMETMLEQDDEWFPLLTLYALSALPRSVFDALADEAHIAQILERSRRSHEDAIREGARLLRKALASEVDAERTATQLTRILPARENEGPNMLSTIERMLFLRHVTFFENLQLDQLRSLARICQEMSVNEGEYFITKGEAGDSLFIVVEGEVHVLVHDASSKEEIVIRRGPGDVLGEISLFDGGLRSADAVAASTTLLLVVYRDTLDNALADDPGIALDMLRSMAQIVRENNKSITDLSMKVSMMEIDEGERSTDTVMDEIYTRLDLDIAPKKDIRSTDTVEQVSVVATEAAAESSETVETP